MEIPDGYAYTLGGRSILMCTRCGSMIGYNATDKHDTFHKALFYAGLERFLNNIGQSNDNK